MREGYILLGISVVLTILPLAVLGLIGMDMLAGLIEFKSLEGIYLNLSLDKLMLAVTAKIFLFVFGVMSIIQAANLGLFPKFWDKAKQADAKK